MKKEQLKRIFEFLEEKENKIPKDKGSFKWRLSFNEQFTKEDLVQKGDVDLSYSNIVLFPKELDGLYVKGYFDLWNCKNLTSLPNDLKVGGFLSLANCVSLTSLPNNLEVGRSLNMSNCTSLTSLPNDLKVGNNLYIENTIFSKMTDEKIRAIIPDGYINGKIIK